MAKVSIVFEDGLQTDGTPTTLVTIEGIPENRYPKTFAQIIAARFYLACMHAMKRAPKIDPIGAIPRKEG